MSDVKTYNSAEVSVIVGTRRATGLVEGSFVTAIRDAQTFTKQVGSDGEITRSKTNNKAGSVQIVVQQGSDFNDFLSELHLIDENTSNGIVPIMVIDDSGTTNIFARQAWIQKPADMSRAAEAGEVTWTIDTGRMDIFIGGN